MYNIIAMLHDIVVSAYAKINIGLRVLPKRSDGYHYIESIFHTVSLCDVYVSALYEKHHIKKQYEKYSQYNDTHQRVFAE